MTNEKFGKVFLKCDGMDQTHICSKWKELPFACSSNSDLTWYGADGDVHNQFKKFIGHRFSLGFKITADVGEETKEAFFGRLNLTHNLGEGDAKIVQTNRTFSIDNPTFERLTKTEHLETLADYLMPSNSDNPGEGKLLYYVLICVFCDSLKHRELVQRIKLPHKMLTMVMKQYADSIIGDNNGGPGGIASLFGAAMVNPSVLRGIKLSEMRVLQTSYDLMTQLATRVREEAVAIVGENEKLVQPIVNFILSTCRQGCLENCQEFKEMSTSEQLVVAQDVIYGARGYPIILEAVALETGVIVDDDVRETYLFEKFIYHFVVQMGKIQDIFPTALSWSVVEPSSKSFQEAKKTITQQANDNMKEFLVISNLLVKLYDDSGQNKEGNGGISSYVSLAKRIICGFIQWQTFRHPQLVYDCYVESNI